ncbi:MAG: hypothetical protein JXX14_12330 [Deltaproteobacteria bacterium]|nr:hypothetical protein [Deltaproteobacteria bacterium]
MARNGLKPGVWVLLTAIVLAGCFEADDGDGVDSLSTDSESTSEMVLPVDSESGTNALGADDSESATAFKGCTYAGEDFDAGEPISSVKGTNCRDCRCEPDGTVSCVDTECVQMCEYGGNVYAAGANFPADDGCNTCFCDDTGEVGCTDMACVTPCENIPNAEYFEPGCGGEALMPVIAAGCYQKCTGSPCATGICQVTDINPCICEPGQECCAACGMWEHLCLDAPASCGLVDTQFAITAGGKSFGECMGECQFSFEASVLDNGECASVTLNVCGWGADSCTRVNTGLLTPTGNAKLSGLAVELSGHALNDVYGCPDCADGGASQLALTMSGVEKHISYEFGNPPAILSSADAFTSSVINALNICVSNENIVVDDSCIAVDPR